MSASDALLRTLASVSYRLVYGGLAALAVAVVALGIALAPAGDPMELPAPIEAVFPLPGDSVIRQTVIEVDMAVGYEAQLTVDGFPVPPSEMGVVEATGVHRWSPSPASLFLAEWRPGLHTVEVQWRSVTGLPEVGSFSWSFRVQ